MPSNRAESIAATALSLVSLALAASGCGGSSPAATAAAESSTTAAAAAASPAPTPAPEKAPATGAPPEIVREIARLTNGKPTARVEAAMKLEELGTAAESARSALLEALASEDPDLRAAAARAAAAVAPGDAVRDALQPLVAGDPDIGVRKAAIDGLVRIGGSEAFSPVRRAIGDDASSVRAHAVAALATSGDADAAPRLADALEDPDGSVRIAAIRGLGQLRAERFTGPLGRLLAAESDDGEKREALAALEAIGSVDAETLPLLVECLASPRRPVRTQAIETLRTVTGEAFPFDPDEMDDATRESQIERWRDWMKKR